jgi:hypothetical protein
MSQWITIGAMALAFFGGTLLLARTLGRVARSRAGLQWSQNTPIKPHKLAKRDNGDMGLR